MPRLGAGEQHRLGDVFGFEHVRGLDGGLSHVNLAADAFLGLLTFFKE